VRRRSLEARRRHTRPVADLCFLPATELAGLIRERRASAVEVLEAHLAQIERRNPTLNAIVTLDPERAMTWARDADAALDRGEVPRPLHGVPMTLKDAFDVAGMRTTCGHPPLAERVPVTDSTVAARLAAAGAIVIGHTNVPPLLADFQTANPIFGRTANPHDPSRTAGGSSGGAAAALAAGLSPLEVGSDTGGSVRLPAHCCGVYALKPSQHRIPLSGHIPPPPGTPRADRILTVAGPMARSLDDLELALILLSGPDMRDSDVQPLPLEPSPTPTLAELRLAWTGTLPGAPIASAITSALEGLAGELSAGGAPVEQRLPDLDFAAQHQLFRDLANLLHHVEAGEPSVPDEHLTLGWYATALHQRDRYLTAWETFFGEYDALLCPVAMTSAFPHRPTGGSIPVDGVEIYYWDFNRYTGLANLTGLPALVMPLARDEAGMPLGLQVVGPRFSEMRLLAIGRALEPFTIGFVAPIGY
jgi:amidase